MRVRHGAPVGLALALIAFGVLLTLREAGVIAEEVSVLWIVVTAVGVGLLIAVFSGRRPGAGLVLPLVLIAIGGTELLKDAGRLGEDFSVIPPVIVAVGLGLLLGGLAWRLSAPEAEDGVVTKRIPLDGASEAQVSIVHGGGELRVGEHHDQYNLVEGTFDGGVREQVDRDGDRLIARLEPVRGRRSRQWDVRLKPGVPLDLAVQGGAQRSTLDLSRLLVRSLVLETGASSTSLTMPERGQATARIRAGGASVDVRIPPAVGARIRMGGGLSSRNVDESRFPRTGDVYQSPDFLTAGDRVELDIEGGAASFSVR
jgi:hypothetical protein